MTLRPIYLTFPDEATARAVLFDGEAPRFEIELANPMPMPIANDAGEPVEGYHVNAICSAGVDLSALDEWRTYPATPFASWAL